MSNNSALVIIDVQNDVVAQAVNRADVIEKIGLLVEQARIQHVPVVWVQHSAEGMPIDSAGWQIVDELEPAATEPIVHKRYGDAFEDTPLAETLAELGVRRLVITGAQTDACIRSTLHGSLARGYDTTLVGDAHTTEDMRQWGSPISPEDAIAYTNLYWQSTSAPGRTTEVVTSGDVTF